MANIRCPMCSKLNTPDAQVCSYCGARLKPVQPPSATPDPGTPRSSGADDDAPDWLRSLRSDSPGSGQEEQESAEPEAEAGDMPDWLSRIRDRSADEPEGEAGEVDAPNADASNSDVPDWMRGLQGADPSTVDESSAGEEDQASADWFGRLQDATAPAETPEVDQPADKPDDSADWLRGLADESLSEPDAGQPGDLPTQFSAEAEQAGGEEDWMNMLSSWAPGQAETPREEPQPDLPDQADEDFSWLAGLEQAAAPDEVEKPREEAESTGLTGFLSELEQAQAGDPASPDDIDLPASWSPEAASSSEGLPDWLDAPSAQDAPAPAGADEGGLPEWLQAMEAQSAGTETPDSEPAAPPSAAAPTEPDPGMPAWLSGTDAPEPPRAEEAAGGELPSWLDRSESQPAAGGEDSGLPAWLSGTESQPSAAQPEDEAFQEDSAIPAWMRAEAEPLEDQPIEAEPAAEGLPDWFSSNEQAPASEQAGQDIPGEEFPYAAETPPAEQPAGEQPYSAPVPDFSFAQEEPQAEAASSEPAGEEEPDWLRDFEAQPSAGASISPLIEAEPALPSSALEGDQPFAVDLPDWLAEDEAAAGEAAEQPVEMSGETLAQADLPEWVKEMRPIESIIPGEPHSAETERRAEKSGPLAGLPGILPAEDMAARYQRPPVYSVKLRASEKQRSQASQFETLLAQEMQPLLIPPQGMRVQGLLVRILIALVLIVALAVPPLMEMEPLAIPALGPDETRRMFEEIDASLAPDEAVLLAVDFEPALAGEMRLASQPVIEHLLQKNARIFVVSTRSSGPALAEQLLQNAAVNYPQFDRQQNFFNLGFLPGDMISLLAFARQPAFAAPANLAGELVWDNPALQQIRGIQDFSRVIVLTDAAETGRIWVEQVHPLMGDVPLLMVTSAQAAPMMAPFVQSGQVTGMVGGMVGGFLYAQWANQADTPAAGYLASFQIGVLLAFALTLIGGLFSGGMALLKRNEKDKE